MMGWNFQQPVLHQVVWETLVHRGKSKLLHLRAMPFSIQHPLSPSSPVTAPLQDAETLGLCLCSLPHSSLHCWTGSCLSVKAHLAGYLLGSSSRVSLFLIRVLEALCWSFCYGTSCYVVNFCLHLSSCWISNSLKVGSLDSQGCSVKAWGT